MNYNGWIGLWLSMVVLAGAAWAGDDEDADATSLKQLLTDESPQVQVRAARTLWHQDAPAEMLVPVLTKVVTGLRSNEERDSPVQIFINDDPSGRAIELLGEIGPEARPSVPVLLAAIDDPRLAIRLAAVDALGAIGVEAKSAVDGLGEALRDTKAYSFVFAHHTWCLSDNAAIALRRIGPDSRSVLLAALNDRDSRVRCNAADALGYLPIAEATLPALMKLLDDPEAPVRATAAFALGRIGPPAAPSAPDLAARLNDPGEWTSYPGGGGIGSSYTVGDHVLAALKSISPEPTSVVPAIVHDLKTKRRLSDAMQEVLRQLGPKAIDASPALESLLEDPAEGLAAAGVLARIAPRHPGLLERFRATLAQDKDRAAVLAARGLGDLGSPAAAAVPDLYAQLERQTGPNPRLVIAAAIVRIDPTQSKAVVELARQLQQADLDRPSRGQDEAVRLWATLGRDAQPAIEHLIEGVKNGPDGPFDDTRVRCAELLVDVSAYRPELIQALIELCGSHQTRTCRRAADALGRMGPAGDSATPVLVKLLGHHDFQGYIDETGDHAVQALAKTGPAAVAELRVSLKDKLPIVRERAATALSLIGRGAQPALSDLNRAAKDPTRRVRAAAVEGLGKVGPTDRATVLILIEALADKHLSVRVAAAVALGKLGPAAKPAAIQLSKLRADAFESARSAAANALLSINRQQ